MQLSTIIFLLWGFACMILAFTLEGGHVTALLAPTAGLIVFGGTIAAIGVAFPLSELKSLPGALKILVSYKKRDLVESINYFRDLSAITRGEGLLSLEKEIDKISDPFLKKGLQLMVDGVESNTLKDILELHMELASIRHKVGIEVFEAAGGFSPTMGIIGTVMGLVHVLSNLSDPSKLGPAIAMAFIATLYGVAFANLAYLPLGAKLKAYDKSELYERQFLLEGLLLLQEGASPTLMVEKLKGFLEKGELAEFEITLKKKK
ncbi:MAG: flagellar motor protein [Candidatus Margulisiibacteriota bacterium]|nr:MAG: flagellar motor protein MotA [Candidatus Margulisbacteria bacterium GWD2_39_127]OGI05211.1 MAG: flagellar motor protein MotA [Candidatus Margulisbacteria bacterium GWF2_38_17]OGI06260.1 MAG: flagellar motor protein MotA [Candidatus Margulisbacteria bacterium GWE2_39_32]PZM78917.1 MAG: flagellar motor protein [Candidatus Margulisiibacteriota bacterium]HAR64499.1 flagellar motor protein [Candidatus Margulisiibacteriota bacterium]